MKRLLFAVLLLAGVLVVPVGAAQAAACSGTSGVTVVVQFPDHTAVGCAPGDPADGFAALKGAGFAVTIVTRFPGAVCRIDGYPNTPCDNMPPANAYWTYYQASPGGGWNKSNYGAASTNPKPGSFEGWRFGDGKLDPDYAIPPAPAPTPRPTPTSKPTARPTGGASNPAPGPDETVGPTAGQSTGPGTATSGTPTGDLTATATDDSTSSANATSGPGGTAATAPTATKDEADDSSGGLHWIWGVVLVGVLGAAAATTAARRRRS